MRPPENSLDAPEQIVVLDTRPELDVLRDALDDQHFMASLVIRSMASDLPLCFRHQTMHQPMGTDRLDDRMVWNDGAEFTVTLQYVNFTYATARRIIDQRGPIDRLFNHFTKRKEAAIDIVAVLAPLIAAQADNPSGE